MKLVVCSVFDSAMNAFARPMFVPAAGVAVRSFADEINRQAQDNPLYAHPDDYTMFDLGLFDEDSGTFIPPPDNRPVVLARGKDLKTKG